MILFWRKWLSAWCGIVALFGLVLAGAAFEVTDGPTQMLLGVMNPAAAAGFDPLHRFSIGLMGAVTFGWGVTLWAAFGAAQALGPDARGIWMRLTVATVAWFVVDSGISVATGFALNAASNTLLLVGYLIPLLASGVFAADAATPAK